MSLKKFRVTKANGDVVIIEAANMEDAISKARSQFGQLPNDINDKIVSDLVYNLTALMRKLGESITEIKHHNKEVEWTEIYNIANKLSEDAVLASNDIKSLVGSMVKISKGEDNEKV